MTMEFFLTKLAAQLEITTNKNILYSVQARFLWFLFTHYVLYFISSMHFTDTIVKINAEGMVRSFLNRFKVKFI